VFYITASVYAFGTIFYGLFGSGQLQSWAVLPNTPIDVEVDGNPIPAEEKRHH